MLMCARVDAHARDHVSACAPAYLAACSQEGMERLCASELTDDDIRMISDALGVHGGYLDIDA